MQKKKLQEIFHQRLSEYGGRMVIDIQPSMYRQAYSHFLEYFQWRIGLINTKTNQNKVVSFFDYVNSDDIQAVAFLQESGGMVGLFRGLFLKLNKIFFKVFSGKMLFSGKHSSINFNLPPDYYRDVAFYLYTVSLEFIVNHEIAHITKGHLKYFQASSGTELFIENEELLENESIMRHAIELDADGMAIAMAILKADRTVRSFLNDKRNLSDAMKFINSSIEISISYHIFTLFIVFLLFEEVSFANTNFLRRTHPPMPIRQLYLLKLVSGYFESKKDKYLSKKRILEIVGNIGVEAQRIFYFELKGQVYEWRDDKRIWTNYWDVLEKAHNELSIKLEPFMLHIKDNLMLAGDTKKVK